MADDNLKDLFGKILDKGGASTPIILLGVGLVSQILMPVMGIALVAGIISSLLRPFMTGNGGAGLAELQTVEENATIYLTFYYPKSSEDPTGGRCLYASGQHVYYRNSSTGETIDLCTASDDAINNARTGADKDNWQVAVKFNGNKFGRGALATHFKGYWPGGSPYPLSPSLTIKGQTYWLSIPNLPSDIPGVPVVDHYGEGKATGNGKGGSALMRSLDGINGFDGRRTLDFAAKSAADEAYWRSKICTAEVTVSGQHFCKIEGVTVKYGNPFITNDISPVSGATKEQGTYTGDFAVDHSLAIPDSLIGDPAMNPNYGKPTHIILHYLAEQGEGSNNLLTAQEANRFFTGTLTDTNPDNNIYVQFIISRNGTIYQLLPETKLVAGACGFNITPGGGVSISIENEGHFEKQGPNQNPLGYTDAEVSANVRLVKYLMEKWDIPASNVISHKQARLMGSPERCNDRSDPGTSFMNAVKNSL